MMTLAVCAHARMHESNGPVVEPSAARSEQTSPPGGGKTIDDLHREFQALQAQLHGSGGVVDGRSDDKTYRRELRVALKANRSAVKKHYKELRGHLKNLEQRSANEDGLAPEINETKEKINAILSDHPDFFGGPLQRFGNIINHRQTTQHADAASPLVR